MAQRHWWQNISIRNVAGALGTAAAFLSGGLAGAQGGSDQPVSQPKPFLETPTGIAVAIGGLLLAVVLVTRASRGR